MRLVFLLAALVVSQAQEEENCQAQTRDMRAIVMMIRQLRTDMNDSVTALQETVASQQKKIASQEREIEDLRNKTEEKLASQEREIEDLRNKTEYLQNKTENLFCLQNKTENLFCLQNNTEYLQNKTENLQSMIKKLQQTVHHAVGFSVRSLDQVSGGVMNFSSTVENTDNSYNEATGVFTCKTPGYYYFSTTLVKALYYNDVAYCLLNKNGGYLVVARTMPGLTSHEGETAAVASAYVHLFVGDTIVLSHCTPRESWDLGFATSFFSGYLVTPDAA